MRRHKWFAQLSGMQIISYNVTVTQLVTRSTLQPSAQLARGGMIAWLKTSLEAVLVGLNGVDSVVL
jgi:hypothetical protein